MAINSSRVSWEALLKSGAVDEARAAGRPVLKISHDELLPHGIVPALQLLAGVAIQQTRYELAAHLLGFAEARFSVSRQVLLVDVETAGFLQSLREHVGSDTLAALMAERAAWPEKRAIDEAQQV